MEISRARRLLIVILGLGLFTTALVACGESAEERQARREAESTRALMREIFASVAVALTASVEPGEFRDPANRAKIAAALGQLAENAEQLEQHSGLAGGAREYLSHSIARDARDVERAYMAEQYGRAAFLVQQITENCIGCHTRLPDDEDSVVAKGFVDETLFGELPLEPRASLQMATRRFDDARLTLEQLIASDEHAALLLNALTDSPSPTERVQQGGYVGYVIITLGIVAVLIGLVRWAIISSTGRRVAAQLKLESADTGNPLGRVLDVYEQNREMDTETLELKIDEVVLRETAKLSRLLWLVKVVSVVAPLLGLLGTVTGMIQTFQAITLFGAGDPKMMAGGISEALVTTMLGLTIAIPLVLLHAALANSTRRITETLDEQGAGLIATSAERAAHA